MLLIFQAFRGRYNLITASGICWNVLEDISWCCMERWKGSYWSINIGKIALTVVHLPLLSTRMNTGWLINSSYSVSMIGLNLLSRGSYVMILTAYYLYINIIWCITISTVRFSVCSEGESGRYWFLFTKRFAHRHYRLSSKFILKFLGGSPPILHWPFSFLFCWRFFVPQYLVHYSVRQNHVLRWTLRHMEVAIHSNWIKRIWFCILLR